MRDKQRLLRTLIEDIVADIGDNTGEIVLVVHWKWRSAPGIARQETQDRRTQRSHQ